MNTRRGHRWRVIPVAVILVILTVVVYAQVRNHDYTNLDDDIYIVENHHLQKGLSCEGLRWAFTTTRGSNWIPLTWVSLLANAELGGLAARNVLLANVALQALCAVVLFLMLVQMTGDFWPSAFVASLFAVHPLNVESVAWASERKDVLCTLFWLLTLWSYHHYTRSRCVRRYLLVSLGLVAALLAKPMAVTLVFVLLLLDYWPLGRLHDPATGRLVDPARLRGALIEKAPWFVLSAMSCVVTYWVQARDEATEALAGIAFLLRVENALVSYVTYVGKLLWPHELGVLYQYPTEGFPIWQILVAAGLLLGASVLCIAQLRRRPFLAVGWFWFLGVLVPVIGLVQVGGQAMADRYMHIPMIGLGIMAAWGGAELTRRFRAGPAIAAGIACTLVATLATTAWHQVGHWRTGSAVFARALALNPENATARVGLGIALVREGEVDRGVRTLGAALRIPLNPTSVNQRVARAIAGIGSAQQNSGTELGISRALLAYRVALIIEPDSAEYQARLGFALLALERTNEAEQQFAAAIRLDPKLAAGHRGLALVAELRSDWGTAVMQYRELVQLKPQATSIVARLAWILATHPDPAVRDADAAVQLCEEAVRRTRVASPQLLDVLAAAYAAAGRFDAAVRTAERASEAALRAGQDALAADIAERRKLYLEKRPLELEWAGDKAP